MPKLVLVRHGESEWNRKNLFTGWMDVDLSEKGVEEAHAAGRKLKAAGHVFDMAFDSILKRSQHTLSIILEELGQEGIPVVRDVALNERHYGALQGLNKAETAEKYGEAQVHLWRRSFDVPPPKDKNGMGESLKDTCARVMPFVKTRIWPELRAGKRVIIAAHGNSLRALVKELDGISDDKIAGLEIPTGQPLVYELDENLNPLSHGYL
ncbi:MAG TPA: 2,3-diphosphoglycerate-dependent phosphoglycerate mutase [Rhodospirillaceae bacterium]|nr:MAG: phosphoglyceromutase [Alphaproteobacteria bacterium GWF2_58_20]HAU29431.1 2,3-diphosphoglycerate-dependent phosphoglycerate mutase [Rhodospirillaceae bacterium]